MSNPYRDSLKGLEIPDPVESFFAFCKEREAIRERRESGQSAPWTRDPIFQHGRFLNVFREDDRGTKAVYRFVEPVQKEAGRLIHALFFARWCNRDKTLDLIDPDLLDSAEELRSLLQTLPQPWASEVYPVVPATWEGREYERLEAATDMLFRAKGFLLESIQSAEGNVMEATKSINREFRMSNDFPIFMALVDLARFEPELISPESPVPTGIGAEPFLDLLQEHLSCDSHQSVAERMIELQGKLWPEAKRRFLPIDIEYLSCECRKYYSYRNGTKRFEGKNLFVPEGSHS
ncbi:MAG: putative DNA base hypermodification protein [Candidatus Krumholzibacteria bacterium]|jgi:hypothetical protein|nr:putative DNA base hypermodification protein [Candidatus Krumholzibacteria bacterium]MDP6668636.1 putative DNA base hypermodification protein [Candidatus Krumholzibacteria bacterium]MDP6798188.1 putative DNA base hypermodification protein [Candidatus Krumholzibacteria bacterium]MDP7022411.1 putative DNA base hypermodification protein [Candidatus Krumholzibacteria bacterium]